MTPLQLILAGAFLFACGFVWGQRAALLRGLWCDLTHDGGDIQRDSLRRITWKCRKCGQVVGEFDEDTHS